MELETKSHLCSMNISEKQVLAIQRTQTKREQERILDSHVANRCDIQNMPTNPRVDNYLSSYYTMISSTILPIIKEFNVVKSTFHPPLSPLFSLVLPYMNI